MIVRDEEAVLARCLASVAEVVDEMIVVDTGSRDDTVGVAGSFGARIVHHDRTGRDGSLVDFSAARNDGLDHARGRYVLVLDADEVLLPASVPLLRSLIRSPFGAAGSAVPVPVPVPVPGAGAPGYVVERRNLPPGAAEPAWVDHAVRLFPNRPDYRFRRRVHETIDDAILAGGGRLCRSGIVLHHHLPGPDEQQRKALAYVRMVEADVAAAPDDADRLIFLAADYHKLRRFEDATRIAERICELAPDDPSAWVRAATYHVAIFGDGLRAREELLTALRLAPADADALSLLAAIDEAAATRSAPEASLKS